MMPLPDAPTPPAPEMAIALRLQRANQSLIFSLVDDYQKTRAALWYNISAAPQDIFDEFDDEAEALLDTIQARLDCIEAIAIANGQVLTDYVPTDMSTVPAHTLVGDGTVTVP